MTATAIPVELARSITDLRDIDDYPFVVPDRTRTGPVCGTCTTIARGLGQTGPAAAVRHATVGHVQLCCQATADAAEQVRQETAAESAWLRAAETGDPESWAEEDRERATAVYGYGPPPGF